MRCLYVNKNYAWMQRSNERVDRNNWSSGLHNFEWYLRCWEQGCLGKIQFRGAQHNAKKSIIFYQMFLNFFSHAPFGVSCFCSRTTTSAIWRLLLLPLKKLQMGPFDIHKHFEQFRVFLTRLTTFFFSCIVSRDASTNFLRMSAPNYVM